MIPSPQSSSGSVAGVVGGEAGLIAAGTVAIAGGAAIEGGAGRVVSGGAFGSFDSLGRGGAEAGRVAAAA